MSSVPSRRTVSGGLDDVQLKWTLSLGQASSCEERLHTNYYNPESVANILLASEQRTHPESSKEAGMEETVPSWAARWMSRVSIGAVVSKESGRETGRDDYEAPSLRRGIPRTKYTGSFEETWRLDKSISCIPFLSSLLTLCLQEGQMDFITTHGGLLLHSPSICSSLVSRTAVATSAIKSNKLTKAADLVAQLSMRVWWRISKLPKQCVASDGFWPNLYRITCSYVRARRAYKRSG